MNSKKLQEFRKTVLSYWKKEGRHDLPWRKTKDPYRILVSEVMLQQTQVPRVVPKYSQFLKRFPKIKTLAKAPLSDVLKTWSGLGYNRRAKFLREAAKAIEKRHKGKFPTSYDALRDLPGIGDYTAKAVRVFAFNKPEVFIETNVRAAFLHHFFPRSKNVPDKKLIPLVQTALKVSPPAGGPREWYSALMDYGAHLKGKGVRAHRRSAHYTKQAKFKGSLREVRGAILRSLGFSATNWQSLEAELEFPRKRFFTALESLHKDGLIEQKDGVLRLALE